MIEVKTTKETAVKPAEKTPRRSIPFTLLDRTYIFPNFNSSVYIYRPKIDGAEFAAALRKSLSKTLVHFYPMAGRCRLDGDGILELDCNDEGVPFVEAQADFDLEDLGDLAPLPEMQVLLPFVDRSNPDISSFPMLAVKVICFKCGGVSVAVQGEHHSMDGSSAFHLIKSWSEIARGLEISTQPFLDRTLLLCPRDPPRLKFDHPEYSNSQFGPTTQISNKAFKISVFRLTRDQLDTMKAATAEKTNNCRSYSTFEVLAGHIWKCVCKARGIDDEEKTRLTFSVNARFSRWKPHLPPGFFGNATFRGLSVARVGDLESEPLAYAAAKIHEALVRMDNEYLRSAMDYLGLMSPDLTAAKIGPHFLCGPSFQITSWAKIGLTDADFGWGPPIYTVPGSIKHEKAYIYPSSHQTGGLSVAMALEPHHLESFGKIFYCFESNNENETFI